MRSPLLLAAAMLAAVPAAHACSVVQGYRVPSGFELAEKADTILLGTVVGADPRKDEFESTVIVKPQLLLKGPALPRQVEIRGFLPTARMRPTHSDPRELRQPNPDALMGGCTRYIFEKGMKLLLFFERRDGALVFAGYPFARVSEDVPSDDAPWVKVVRLYARVAALPPAQRRPALIAERDRLRAESNDPDAALIAEELDRELATAQLERAE